MTRVVRTDADGRKFDKDGRELVAPFGDDVSLLMHKDVMDRIDREWDSVFGKPAEIEKPPAP